MTIDDIARILAPEPWMTHAACRGADAALFFPERGSTVENAKAVCAACPVADECLDYALTNGERFGIWGGKSERERRVLRREQGISHRRHRIPHGEPGAYDRCRQRTGTACDACREANTRYRNGLRGAS